MNGESSLVTIVGRSYLQPIADLLATLGTIPYSDPDNQIRVGGRENGYACAVCLLAVVALESYIMRLRYLHPGHPAAGESKAPLVFRGFFPRFAHLDELEECFVLRDSLAHNHLWEISYRWDESTPMELQGPPARRFIYKDNKYGRAVEEATHRTRRLRLHVFPTRVDRRDACHVLETVCAALREMETFDRSVCEMKTLIVKKGSYRPRFDEVVAAFCETS